MQHVGISLAENTMIRINGFAKVRVIEGMVLVLGAIYSRGEEFTIASYRSYAIRSLTDSKLDIVLDKGSSIEPAHADEEVLDKWVVHVDKLLLNDCKNLIVIGPTDAGKSSLTALIANRGLLRGQRPGIIDADVGQADIGPPGCVSAALAERKILWLRELKAKYIRFVGSVTPHRFERRIVAGVVDLYWRLRKDGANLIVVDTDGWTQGLQALEYKAEIAKYLSIDSVIVLGDDRMLVEMARRVFGALPCGVVHLPSPQIRRIRDRDDRRTLRSEAYRRYLTPQRQRVLDLTKLVIQGSCFFSGMQLPEDKVRELNSLLGKEVIIAASETHDTLYAIVKQPLPPEHVRKLTEAIGKQVYTLDIDLVRGALVALLDENMEEKAIGIVRVIDLSHSRITIDTPYEGPVTGIVFGNIRLTDELTEMGRVVRCII